MANERFNGTASKGLILKVLGALLAAGGLAGGYKALAKTPDEIPSTVLNRIDNRLDRMSDDINGLKVDVGILKGNRNHKEEP